MKRLFGMKKGILIVCVALFIAAMAIIAVYADTVIGSPGSGTLSGTSGGVPASATIPWADTRSVTGYRFTVYDRYTGQVLGTPADIYLNTGYDVTGTAYSIVRNDDGYRLSDKMSLAADEFWSEDMYGDYPTKYLYNSDIRWAKIVYQNGTYRGYNATQGGTSFETSQNTDIKAYPQSTIYGSDFEHPERFVNDTDVFFKRDPYGNYYGYLTWRNCRAIAIKCCGLDEKMWTTDDEDNVPYLVTAEPIISFHMDGLLIRATITDCALIGCGEYNKLLNNMGITTAQKLNPSNWRNPWTMAPNKVYTAGGAVIGDNEWFQWVWRTILGNYSTLVYITEDEVALSGLSLCSGLFGSCQPITEYVDELNSYGGMTRVLTNGVYYLQANSSNLESYETNIHGVSAYVARSTAGDTYALVDGTRMWGNNGAVNVRPSPKGIVEYCYGVGMWVGNGLENIELKVRRNATSSDDTSCFYEDYYDDYGYDGLWLYSPTLGEDIYLERIDDYTYKSEDPITEEQIAVSDWKIHSGNRYLPITNTTYSLSGNMYLDYYDVRIYSDSNTLSFRMEAQRNSGASSLSGTSAVPGDYSMELPVPEGWYVTFGAGPFDKIDFWTNFSDLHGAIFGRQSWSSYTSVTIDGVSYQRKALEIRSRTTIYVSCSKMIHIYPRVNEISADFSNIGILDASNHQTLMEGVPSRKPWDGFCIGTSYAPYDYGYELMMLDSYWSETEGCYLIPVQDNPYIMFPTSKETQEDDISKGKGSYCIDALYYSIADGFDYGDVYIDVYYFDVDYYIKGNDFDYICGIQIGQYDWYDTDPVSAGVREVCAPAGAYFEPLDAPTEDRHYTTTILGYHNHILQIVNQFDNSLNGYCRVYDISMESGACSIYREGFSFTDIRPLSERALITNVCDKTVLYCTVDDPRTLTVVKTLGNQSYTQTDNIAAYKYSNLSQTQRDNLEDTAAPISRAVHIEVYDIVSCRINTYDLPMENSKITVPIPENCTVTVTWEGSTSHTKSFDIGSMNLNATEKVLIEIPYYSVDVYSGEYITAVHQTTTDGIYARGESASLSATVQASPEAEPSRTVAYPYSTISVRIRKDNSRYAGFTGTVDLSTSSTSNTKAYSTAASDGLATFTNIPSGITYFVWIDGEYTGESISGAAGTQTTQTRYAYLFDHWNVFYGNTVTGRNSNPTGITAITKKTAIYAIGKRNTTEVVISTDPGNTTVDIDYYTISLTAGDYISSVSGAGTYLKGSKPTISAIVETSDASGTEMPYEYSTITVNVRKDNSVWISASKTVYLSNSATSNTQTRTAVTVNGVASFTGCASNTTYYVWTDDGYTGVTVTGEAGTQIETVESTFVFDEWTKNPSGSDLVSSINSVTKVNGITQPSAYLANGTLSEDTTYSDMHEGIGEAFVDYYTVSVEKGNCIESVSGSGVFLKGTRPTVSATVQASTAPATIVPYNYSTITVTVRKDGSAWSGAAMNVYLSNSATTNSKTRTAATVNGVASYAGCASNTTYYVWTDDGYTGQSVAGRPGTQTQTITSAISFDNWTKAPSGNDLTSYIQSSTTVNGLTMPSAYKAQGKASATTTYTNQVEGTGNAVVDYYTVSVLCGPNVEDVNVGTNRDNLTEDTICVLKGATVYFVAEKGSANGYSYSDTITWTRTEGSLAEFTGTNEVPSDGKEITAKTTMIASTTRTISRFCVTLHHDENIKQVVGAGTYGVGDTVTIIAYPKDTEYPEVSLAVRILIDGQLSSGHDVKFIKDYGTPGAQTFDTTEISTGKYAATVPYSENDYVITVDGEKWNSSTIRNKSRCEYEFIKWEGGFNANTATYTFTMPNHDVDITAYGKHTLYSTNGITIIDDPDLNMYRLTLTGDAGIASTSGAGIYEGNTIATFGAVLRPGYRFINWKNTTVNLIQTGNLTGNISMARSYALFAATLPNKVTIEVNLDDDDYIDFPGTVTLVSGGNEYTTEDDGYGNMTTVTPIPNGTYAVYADGEDTGVRVVVNDNDPTGELNYYTVTVTGDSGIADTTGSGIYLEGTEVTVTAVVRSEYEWKNWTGTYSSDDQEYTFTVTQKTDLKAHTNQHNVTITYVMNGGMYAGITSSISQTYPCGTTITLITPTAPNGKEFLGWFENKTTEGFSGGVGTGGAQFVLLEDITVYASYSGGLDLGVTANTIYGSPKIGSQFMASATILNHSGIDVKPADHIDLTVKVYNGSTLLTTTTISDIVVPEHNRNLVSVIIPTTSWTTSGVYKVVWTLDYSRATFSDVKSTNNESYIPSIRANGNGVYGNPARPSYSTTVDPQYNQNAPHVSTAVNRYFWESWTYENGAFKLNQNSDKLGVTLILKPENENGLRTYVFGPAYKLHDYTTRSGYGFSIHTTYNDLELPVKRSNVTAKTTVGSVTATMLYPEFNYLAEAGKCSDLIATKVGPAFYLSMPRYADYVSNDPNDQYAHYTPIWIPDGLYQPVTVIGGLWTPVGELKATVLQGELTTKTQMDAYGVYTNKYTISGSMYDDLYN